MGVDLRLLPLGCLHSTLGTSSWGYSHTVLDVPRRRELWESIDKLGPVAIPVGSDISSFVGRRVPDGAAEGETMYGRLDKDSYGTAYTWIKAGDLVVAFFEHLPGHPVTQYLAALPVDSLVILDWH